MLAHAIIPRACPVLSASELASIGADPSSALRHRAARGKPKLWASLLRSAYVLHCFPPGGDPAPGERRAVFMGHPKHTQAEVAFAKRQGLWRLDQRRCKAHAGDTTL